MTDQHKLEVRGTGHACSPVVSEPGPPRNWHRSLSRRTVLFALASGFAWPAWRNFTGMTPAGMELQATPIDAESTPPVPAFPLAVSPNDRYLQDARGRPLLVHGDAAWSLIAQLTREDAESYLRDRRARGFNTILVSLVEHLFSSNAPANIYGDSPFQRPGDFTTPNEAYFAHAEFVLRRTAEEGFLVLLAPAYVGAGGGPHGWYQEMLANGVSTMRRYGAYLGRRYRSLDNIVWVHGGDYSAPRREIIDSVAEGIVSEIPGSLHTAHGSPGLTAADHWGDAPWLALNNVYTYDPVASEAARAFGLSPPKPFILIESRYEEPGQVDEWQVRGQAYQALLSGAAGHVFGNAPIWHFDGPGTEPPGLDWRAALSSRGAVSMTHLAALLVALRWWDLVPDLEGEVLVGGRQKGRAQAVAAATHDGRLAIVYSPTIRTLKIALARLAGPRVRARWYDPSAGLFFEALGSPFATASTQPFRSDRNNRAGYEDWVLVLESLEAA